VPHCGRPGGPTACQRSLPEHEGRPRTLRQPLASAWVI
jgi:hypothetical protein